VYKRQAWCVETFEKLGAGARHRKASAPLCMF